MHAGGHERGLRSGLVAAHQGDHQLAIRGVLDPVDTAGQDVVVDPGLARDAAEQGFVGVATQEGQPHDAATDGVEIAVQRALVHMLRFADEAARGRVLRVQEHPGDRAGLDHLAGVEHGHAVADTADHIHLVGDQHDGQAQLAIDLRQQRQHRRGGLRVKRTGRLVAQQDLRTGRQRAGDADALFLATGQLRRILLRMRFEAHSLQQLGHARVDLRLRRAGQFQWEGDIAGHRARGQQVEVLEDHADAPAQRAQAVRVQRGDILTADQQPATTGFFQAVDHADKCRLAGAGMADDAENLTGLDGQVQRLQRADFAAGNGIGFVQALELDHGRGSPAG